MILVWLVVLAVGCALRLHGLGVHSLWYDECATVHVATAPDLVMTLLHDRHPPLSFLAFRGWIALGGEDDRWLRLLPALLSCLTLLLFARACRHWLGGGAALAATALQAGSAFAVWYGQEVRMYAFVELATVVGMLGGSCWLGGRRARGALLLAFAGALGLGSHYLGFAAPLPAMLLVLLAERQRPVAAWPALAAGVGGALLWLPWILTAVPQQLQARWGFQAQMGAMDLVQLPVRFLLVHLATLPMPLVYAVAGLVWLGLGAAVTGAATRRLLAAAGAPVLAVLVLCLLLPPSFAPNYLIAAAPWTVLAVAGGLLRLPARAGGVAVVVLAGLLVGASWLHRQQNLREDHRAVAAEVLADFRPQDLVVAVTGTPEDFSQASLRHYLRGTAAAAAIVAPDELLARLQRGDRPARVHVLWRAAPYALPQLQRLRDAATRSAAGPMHDRLQHLLFGFDR